MPLEVRSHIGCDIAFGRPLRRTGEAVTPTPPRLTGMRAMCKYQPAAARASLLMLAPLTYCSPLAAMRDD
jgi:hypothetical protein